MGSFDIFAIRNASISLIIDSFHFMASFGSKSASGSSCRPTGVGLVHNQRSRSYLAAFPGFWNALRRNEVPGGRFFARFGSFLFFLHVPVSHSRLERSARCERLSARRRSYGRPRTARPPSAALHSDNWRSKALRRAPAILPQLVLADAVAASAAFIGACSRVSRSLPNSYCRKSKKKIKKKEQTNQTDVAEQ